MRIIDAPKIRATKPVQFKKDDRPFMTPMQYRIVGGLVVIICIIIVDVLFRLF